MSIRGCFMARRSPRWLLPTPPPPPHVTPVFFYGPPTPPLATANPVAATIAGDKQQLLAELTLLAREANYVPFTVEEKILRLEDIEEFKRPNEHFFSFAQV